MTFKDHRLEVHGPTVMTLSFQVPDTQRFKHKRHQIQDTTDEVQVIR